MAANTERMTIAAWRGAVAGNIGGIPVWSWRDASQGVTAAVPAGRYVVHVQHNHWYHKLSVMLVLEFP